MKAIRMITINGRTQSLGAWVRESGLARATVWSRLNLGWSPEDALTKPPTLQARKQTREKTITVDGETDTLVSWSRRSGIEYGVLLGRLRLGWSGKDTVCTPSPAARFRPETVGRKPVTQITLRGRTQTVPAWARENSIRPRIIHKRLRLGWSPEDAVFTPVGSQARLSGILRRNEPRRLTAHGRTQTLDEWSSETGIFKDSLRSRLRLGWSEEEAVSAQLLSANTRG